MRKEEILAMTKEQLDAMVAEQWPERLRKANAKRHASKRRNTLRRMMQGKLLWDLFKAEHPEATCETCKHILHQPAGLSGVYCALTSDWEGYVVTGLDKVCTSWKEA